MPNTRILPFDKTVVAEGKSFDLTTYWPFNELYLYGADAETVEIGICEAVGGSFGAEWADGSDFEFNTLLTHTFAAPFNDTFYLLGKNNFADLFSLEFNKGSFAFEIAQLGSVNLKKLSALDEVILIGELQELPAGLCYVNIQGKNQIDTYNGGLIFSDLELFIFLPSETGLQRFAVDLLLNDLAAANWDPSGPLQIDISGKNSMRTIDSDPAILELQSKGVTTIVNAPLFARQFNGAENIEIGPGTDLTGRTVTGVFTVPDNITNTSQVVWQNALDSSKRANIQFRSNGGVRIGVCMQGVGVVYYSKTLVSLGLQTGDVVNFELFITDYDNVVLKINGVNCTDTQTLVGSSGAGAFVGMRGNGANFYEAEVIEINENGQVFSELTNWQGGTINGALRVESVDNGANWSPI